jgi:hypothetical protein
MPPARNSSILAKVDVPSYLVTGATYTLYLDVVFAALHSVGAVNMPALGLSWTWIKAAPGSFNSAVNVVEGYVSPSLQISGITQSPRAYFSKATATITDLTADGTVFFNLARTSVDGYIGKLGIVSMRYRFVRNS